VVLGLHYAGQYTAMDSNYTQCAPFNEYGGWNGVDGQLQTPATVPSMGNDAFDHVAGLLSAQLDNDTRWVQLGWYTGLATETEYWYNCTYPLCTWRCCQTMGYYVETVDSQGYTINDYGQALVNTARTSAMIYNASSGCWEAYLTYDGKMSTQDCFEGIYHSGAMFAASEMYDASGTAPGLPTSYFGSSSPNTNAALRLHGGNGWVSWNGSLSSYYTETFDEHSYIPGYTISRLSNCCWDFENYKSA